MGSEVYVNILNKNLLASRKLQMGKLFIFQQNTDPKHMSKKTKEFSSRSRLKLEWLAQNPDLNPIEHLWAILDQKADP